MVAFIDAHRAEYGVEPICAQLPIAPSTVLRAQGARGDPATRAAAAAARSRRCVSEIRRVYEENFRVYGARKVWRQLRREGIDVARCTVERLMRALGLQGAVRGRKRRTTIADDSAAAAARSGEPAIPGEPSEPAVGGGLHVRRDVGRLRLRRVRDRCIRPAHHRLARGALDAYRTGAGRAGASAVWSRPESRASCITATAGSNICRFATPSDWPKPASSHRWVASAIRTTTRWPKRSSGCTRPRSFTAAAHGDIWRPWNTQRSSGSIGSITVGCWSQSAMYRRQNSKRSTIIQRVSCRWRPDSNLDVSRKPRAVQSHLQHSSDCSGYSVLH